jgi:hypothetical protein
MQDGIHPVKDGAGEMVPFAECATGRLANANGGGADAAAPQALQARQAECFWCSP